MLQCSKFLQHALPGHASMEIQEQGTELEGNTEQCTAHITTDNMKEHLNRTACGFFNSNCSTPAGSSSVPHDPIMSGFLLACLLMKHQGKHFPARRMQEAGSGTARRLPLEDSLLSRKEESSSALCMSASPGIYWGITCTASEDWTNLIFVCRGDWVLGCSSTWESFHTIYSHCSRAAVPGLLSLLLGAAPAPHFSKREAKLHIPKGSVIHNSSSLPSLWEAELPSRSAAVSTGKASTDYPAGELWAAALLWPWSHAVPAMQLGRAGSSPAFDALQGSTTAAIPSSLQLPSCHPIHQIHQDRLSVLIQGIAPEKIHFGNGHNKNLLWFWLIHDWFSFLKLRSDHFLLLGILCKAPAEGGCGADCWSSGLDLEKTLVKKKWTSRILLWSFMPRQKEMTHFSGLWLVSQRLGR